MRVILHNSKLSPYSLEPQLVSLVNLMNLILLPLPITLLVAFRLRWDEVFSGVGLPVAQFDDSANFTKSPDPNYLLGQVQGVRTRNMDLARFRVGGSLSRSKHSKGGAASLHFLINARRFLIYSGCAASWLGNSIL